MTSEISYGSGVEFSFKTFSCIMRFQKFEDDIISQFLSENVILYVAGHTANCTMRDLTLQWRIYNELTGVTNHQPHDCLFTRRSKKTSKLRVTGLWVGISPVTSEFPAQRASNTEMLPFDDVIMKEWQSQTQPSGKFAALIVYFFCVYKCNHSCPLRSLVSP